MGGMRGAVLVLLTLALGLLFGALILHHSSEWQISQIIHHINGLYLTEEVQQPQVLHSTTINLEPGQVYQVAYDVNGIRLEPRSSQLIETLNLTNVNLATGDVVAPVLYDWYFDGRDDAVVYSVHLPSWSSLNLTFAGEVFDVNYWGAAVGGFGHRPEANRFLAFYENKYAPSFRVVLTLFNATSGEAIGGVEPTLMSSPTGYHVFSAIVTTGGSLEAYVDGEVKCSDTFDTTDVYFPLDVDTTYAVGARTCYGEVSAADCSKSRISYALVEADGKILSLVSATFTNGTHYFDLITGNAATVYGGPARMPAENPTLWLVKSLASDGKLHLKYVPAGSVFCIHYNGMVYEWQVKGTPNAAGLIEDYAIDIASVFGQTVLPNVTIELIYPSQNVRVYAPAGFTVKLEGANFSMVQTVNSSYVDFAVPSSGSYTIELLGAEKQVRVNTERSGDDIVFTCATTDNFAVSNAPIEVVAGNTVVAQGYTDDLGRFVVPASELEGYDSVVVKVAKLDNGVYEHGSQVVELSGLVQEPSINSTEVQPVQQAAPAPASTGSSMLPLLLLFGAVILLIAVAGGRKR